MLKTKLKNQIIVVLSSIFFLMSSLTLAIENASNEFNKKEKNAIEEHFPGYRLLQISDLDPDSQEIMKYDVNKYFFLIRGDFDGTASEDFACLLYNKKHEKVVFAIFLNSSNQYKLSYHESYKASRWDENTVLGIKEAGTPFSEMGYEDEIITLKNPAIELIVIEKTSSVYYWDDKNKKICVVGAND